MKKHLLNILLFATIGFIWILLIRISYVKHENKFLRTQIQLRDSVNAHNVRVHVADSLRMDDLLKGKH